MRLRDLIRDPDREPLLKVGAWAMVIALGFATVVSVGAYLDRPEVAVANAAASEPEPATGPLVRTDPGISPWVERDIPPPRPAATAEPQPAPDSAPRTAPAIEPQPAPAPKPRTQPNPPEPPPEQPLAPPPAAEDNPSQKQDQPPPVEGANPYHFPPGAIMTLTIPELGIRNAPVMDSVTKSALNRGVVHLPDTSLPWSDTPERNVYLAGHRLGWPSTGSHLVFYRLPELTGGERVLLRAGDGESYAYRVLGSFVVGPQQRWVTGRVRGRDLLTLQTCTPIPTFEKRLIVRAERV